MDRRQYWALGMLIFYFGLFSLYFFVLPFIASSYPSTRGILAYFPFFFIFPFFWGFGGGRRRGTSQNQNEEEKRKPVESTITDPYSGVQDPYNPDVYFARESKWRIIGIAAICLVFVLIAMILFLFLG